MKLLLLISQLLAFAVTAFGQGQIYLDNIYNTSTSPTATTDGLFFLCTGGGYSLINQDFNASFYGGSDSTSLALIGTFAGAAAVGDNAAGPGTFLDPRGFSIAIPGATNMAYFQIQAWLGTAPSYGQAFSLGSPVGSSGVFSNPVAGPPNSPPDLINMPAVLISYPDACPEPGSLTLVGLAAAVLLAFRWLAGQQTRYCGIRTR